MLLTNLTVDRIIIYQIYRRDEDSNMTPPLQSHEYVNFDHGAMEAFKYRIINAIGHDSKAVQMEIVNQEPSDLPPLINRMVDQDNDSFAVSSYCTSSAPLGLIGHFANRHIP